MFRRRSADNDAPAPTLQLTIPVPSASPSSSLTVPGLPQTSITPTIARTPSVSGNPFRNMRNLSSNLKKHASMLSINTKTDATTAAELPLRSASANSTFSGNGVSGLVSIRNGIRILRADQHQPMYADGPVEIMAGLYLGDQLNAENRQQLARFGISYILNVAEEVNNPYDGSKKQKRKASGSIEMSAYSNDSSPSPSPSPGYGSPLMCASPVSSECESTASMMSAASSPSPSPSTNSGINSDSDSDSDSITYKKLSLSHHQEDLISFINEAFDYIDAARQSGATVLVHCQLGVSRSASMVVAYVMRSQKMTYEQAYAFVKGKSPCISPNTFLIFQLCEYEKTLGIAKAPTSDSCNNNGHSTSSNGSSGHVSRSKSAHGVISKHACGMPSSAPPSSMEFDEGMLLQRRPYQKRYGADTGNGVPCWTVASPI